MPCIKKIQIDDVIYEANVDFRNVIKCIQISTDDKIGDFERALGTVCTMFGADGIDKANNNPEHYEKLLKWIIKYISCGEQNDNDEKEPDMDYIEDEHLIRNSFIYDYKYNPYDMESLSWEDFYKDLSYLSDSEFGNCCALNRVRNLRRLDLSKIEDAKEREEMRKAKERVALKKYKKEVHLTKEQEESVNRFNEMLKL